MIAEQVDKKIQEKKEAKNKEKAWFLSTTIALTSLATGVLASSLSQGQGVNNYSKDWDSKNTTELFEAHDSLSDHETIINQNVKDILTKNKEKWMEIISQHLLLEINALRKQKSSEKVNIWDLTISSEVQTSAQQRADHCDNLWKITHGEGKENVYNRLKTNKVALSTCSENLASWEITIKQLVADWLLSPVHTDNMINPKFTKMWLWYKNGKRVLIFVG